MFIFHIFFFSLYVIFIPSRYADWDVNISRINYFSGKNQYCEFMCLARSSDLPLINTYIAASRLERAEKCARTIISYLHVPSYLIGWTVSAGNSRLSVYGTVNGDRAESGLASARRRPIILHIFTCDGAPAARCTKLMSEEAKGRMKQHGSAGRDRNDFWMCVCEMFSLVRLFISQFSRV